MWRPCPRCRRPCSCTSPSTRSCATATDLQLLTASHNEPLLLLAAGAHVHSWPDPSVAPPRRHASSIALSSLPRSADGLVSLQIVDGAGAHLLTLQLMTDLSDCLEEMAASTAAHSSDALLEITLSVSCEAGDGQTGALTVSVASSGVAAEASCPVPLKVADQTRNGQLLCDHDEFRRRTNLGLKRFQLCSLKVLTQLRPYRPTTLDSNGEMQHESLISTASNEHTHKRLAGFSRRGRGEDLATGAMIEGDYVDSRRAAMRHTVPGCGADVGHDELQAAALANKLAGFDGSGGASGQLPTLLPTRTYDFDLPRAASPAFVLVKHLAGGNAFNHRKPQRSVAATEASVCGALPLPAISLRSSLAHPPSAVSSPQLPAPVHTLVAAQTAALTAAAQKVASRKRKACEWTPHSGCRCESQVAHTKHVRKCAKWLCTCKPPATGRGGDNTHVAGCLRGEACVGVAAAGEG